MLEGKTVVVTGGAGLLGRALCRCVAKAGGTPVIADMDESKARSSAEQINSEMAHNRALGIALDITNSDSIQFAIRYTEERTGKIDALVNCAYPRNRDYGKKLEDVSYGSFCDNVSTHLGGYFLTSKEFGFYFKSREGGNVVNISSVYGVVAPRFEIYEGTNMTMPVEYAAIKSGVLHLTRYMAKYFKGCNIRFNCLSPGGIRNGQHPSFLARYAEYSLSKGMLDADDVGGTLVFLLSDDSRFINGQNIIVDDGWTL